MRASTAHCHAPAAAVAAAAHAPARHARACATPQRGRHARVVFAATSPPAGAAASAPSRRAALLLPATLLALSSAASPPSAWAKGAPSGFNPVKDTQKGYAFFYPVGWQEVTLEGQDKAFRDVIEPLESVSLSVAPTARGSLAEAGTPQEVAQTLVAKSGSPQAKTELVSASQRTDASGGVYYTFEFTSTARGVTRHAVTCLGIANGKVFTLTVGASAARWPKVADRLRTVADSLVLLGY